jgi:hypothetical protein
LSVAGDPFINSILEVFNERSSINSQPTDVNCLLKSIDVISGSVKRSDSFIKHIKGWFSRLNTFKDFAGHPFEGIINFFLTIIVNFYVFLGSWVVTSLKESLETIS